MDAKTKNDYIKKLRLFNKNKEISNRDKYVYYSMITICGIILVMSFLISLSDFEVRVISGYVDFGGIFIWGMSIFAASYFMIYNGIKGMRKNAKKTL